MKGNTPNGRLLEAIGELNPHGTVMGPLGSGKTLGAMKEFDRRIQKASEEAAFIALYEETQAHSKNCKGKHNPRLRKAVLEATEVYSQIRMRRES